LIDNDYFLLGFDQLVGRDEACQATPDNDDRFCGGHGVVRAVEKDGVRLRLSGMGRDSRENDMFMN
jgi:hypothetical protein